jgi:hypothetical protein
MYLIALQLQVKHVPWRLEEDVTLLKMRNKGLSREHIHVAFPHRANGRSRCGIL